MKNDLWEEPLQSTKSRITALEETVKRLKEQVKNRDKVIEVLYQYRRLKKDEGDK
jgi:hypothetical protein